MPPTDEGPRSRHRPAPGPPGRPKPKPASRSKSKGFGPIITLVIVSIAMLILPLSTYFGIRLYIVDSTTIAAMGAIVMVQIIIAAYIYKAWQDENSDQKPSFESKIKKN